MIDKFSTGRRRLRENIAQKTGKEAADNTEFEERWQPVIDLRDKVGCWGLHVGCCMFWVLYVEGVTCFGCCMFWVLHVLGVAAGCCMFWVLTRPTIGE